MINGYMQKVLFVDLTTRSTVEKPLPNEIYREFIGGQGLGVRVLYEHMVPHADPLGPDNIIGFVSSPLTGAGFHGARLQVVGKSPADGVTPMWAAFLPLPLKPVAMMVFSSKAVLTSLCTSI